MFTIVKSAIEADIMERIDEAVINFSPQSLFVLNIVLGFIMLGVALNLKVDHFRELLKTPRVILVGFTSQFVLLPILTFLMILVADPMPSMALGMILVASCPGGNMSNFITHLSKGNTALSVSLTGISTLMAIFMTPLNFAIWGSINPKTAAILQNISINNWEMFKIVFLLLAIPLALGMFIAHKYPKFTEKINQPVKLLSILIFVAFVFIAFYNNFEAFTKLIGKVFLLVLAHNGIALLMGFYYAKLFKYPKRDSKTIAVETGMQNSGLALVLIFNFFSGMGGMALVAGWWGIWHIISGLTLSYFWSKDNN